MAIVATTLTLAGLLANLGTFYKTVKETKNISEAAGAVQGGVGAVDMALRQVSTSSLVEFTSMTRVEPLVLVDGKLLSDPAISDVFNVLTSLNAAYYLQALAMLGTIGHVAVVSTIDKLNPNRKLGFGFEDYEGGKLFQNDHATPIKNHSIGLEAADKPDDKGTTIDYNSKSVSEISQVSNLAIGKMIEATVSSEGVSVKVPIMIRLNPITTDSQSIVQIMMVGQNHTIKERWMKFKAGELSFSDMIFVNDLIEAHRNTLIRDKSGFYEEAVRRAKTNRKRGLLTANPSLATASNMLVVPQTTIDNFEREIGKRFDNPAVRKEVFNALYAQIIVVIDQARDMVSFYYRGQNLPSTMTLREIKAASKSTGPDVMSIFKALYEGKTPSF